MIFFIILEHFQSKKMVFEDPIRTLSIDHLKPMLFVHFFIISAGQKHWVLQIRMVPCQMSVWSPCFLIVFKSLKGTMQNEPLNVMAFYHFKLSSRSVTCTSMSQSAYQIAFSAQCHIYMLAHERCCIGHRCGSELKFHYIIFFTNILLLTQYL